MSTRGVTPTGPLDPSEPTSSQLVSVFLSRLTPLPLVALRSMHVAPASGQKLSSRTERQTFPLHGSAGIRGSLHDHQSFRHLAFRFLAGIESPCPSRETDEKAGMSPVLSASMHEGPGEKAIARGAARKRHPICRTTSWWLPFRRRRPKIEGGEAEKGERGRFPFPSFFLTSTSA
jgi:hypothetical protein